MSKFFSPSSSSRAYDLGMLILRIGLCFIIIYSHGWQKISGFSDMQNQFVDFLGMGSTIALSLSIFAEFVCAIFVLFGLFTRLAVIPLIINMCTAIILVHDWDIVATAQLPFIFLIGWLTILFLGPGRISIDGLISNSSKKSKQK